MKGLAAWINRSIRRRLFLCFAGLTVPLLALLGLVSYLIAAAGMTRAIDRYSEQILRQAIFHLESYLGDYERNTLMVLGDQFVIDFLRYRERDVYDLYQFSQHIRRNLFNPILGDRSDVEGVFLVGLNGLDLSSGSRSEKYGLFDGARLLAQAPWLRDLPADGRMLVTGVHRQIYAGNVPVISLARRIANPDDPSQTLGMFWVDIGLERLAEISNQVHLGRTGYLCILNRDARVIYHPRPELIGEPAGPALPADAARANNSRLQRALVEGREVLCLSQISPLTGWRLMALVPQSEVTGSITQLKLIIVATGVFFLIAALILSARFSATITRPIQRLQGMMDAAAQGDLDGILPVTSSDEVGRLTQNFNRMLQRIQALIDDVCDSRLSQLEAEYGQREAELKALQAQINPHFLFNTLGTINSLAVLEDAEAISRVVAILGDFLRYTMNTNQVLVTLGEELEQVKRYISLQKFRFGDRIALAIDVPATLLAHPLIKLTLQPLVENACLHGLENSGERSGRIDIAGRREGGALVIAVADNGAGMSPDKLAEIRAALRPDGTAREHIGLGNVNERIRLRYGRGYGLEIESKEGRGTSVVMRLPYGLIEP